MARGGYKPVVREGVSFGAAISMMLHAGALGGAMYSLSSPPQLITLEEQGVEVDIAALDNSESGKGEEKAELDPTPAPEPTKRPETVEEAQNAGDANEDSQSREGEVTPRPLDTVKATAAPEADKVVAAPEAKPDPVESPDNSETPVPTNELARLNEQPAPVAEEPVEEEVSDAIDEEAETPDQPAVPVPVRAPSRPKPNSAQTRERTKPEEQREKRTATSREDRKDTLSDIDDLLNTQENSESGARRVAEAPSLGAEDARSGAQLSASEYEALKGRVSQCWTIPGYVDQGTLKVTLLMRMSRDGFMAEIVNIDVTGVSNPQHARGVANGLQRNLDRRNCNFSDVLPPEKYDTWRDVRVNFAPQDF
jgi:hypothetical protein